MGAQLASRDGHNVLRTLTAIRTVPPDLPLAVYVPRPGCPPVVSRVGEPRDGSDPAGDFAEICESERRNASHLRVVAEVLLVLVLLALSTGWCHSSSRIFNPVFVHVDEVRRAVALDNEAPTWQTDFPHPSNTYVLHQFVSDHCTRCLVRVDT